MINIKKILRIRNPVTGEFEPLLGIKGEDGKSVHIAYSSSPDGTDFKTEWEYGLSYMGLAVSDTPPTDKSQYKWMLVKGEAGTGTGNGTSSDTGTSGSSGGGYYGHVHYWDLSEGTYGEPDCVLQCAECYATITYKELYNLPDEDVTENNTRPYDPPDEPSTNIVPEKPQNGKTEEEVKKEHTESITNPVNTCRGIYSKVGDGYPGAGGYKCTACNNWISAAWFDAGFTSHYPHQHTFFESPENKGKHVCGCYTYRDHDFTSNKQSDNKYHKCSFPTCSGKELHEFEAEKWVSLDPNTHARSKKCVVCNYELITNATMDKHTTDSDGVCSLCGYGLCASTSFSQITGGDNTLFNGKWQCDECGEILDSEGQEHPLHKCIYNVYKLDGHYCKCGRSEPKPHTFNKVIGASANDTYHKIIEICSVCGTTNASYTGELIKHSLVLISATDLSDGAGMHRAVLGCQHCNYKSDPFNEQHKYLFAGYRNPDCNILDRTYTHEIVEKCACGSVKATKENCTNWENNGTLLGITSLICKDCGQEKLVKKSEAVGITCNHPNLTLNTLLPTKDKDGFIKRSCPDCGEVVGDTVKLNATGKDYETTPDDCTHIGTTERIQQHFCETKGFRYTYCTKCGFAWEYISIEPVGHIYEPENPRCVLCGKLSKCNHSGLEAPLLFNSNLDGTHTITFKCSKCGLEGDIVKRPETERCSYVNGICEYCYDTKPMEGGGAAFGGSEECLHSSVHPCAFLTIEAGRHRVVYGCDICGGYDVTPPDGYITEESCSYVNGVCSYCYQRSDDPNEGVECSKSQDGKHHIIICAHGTRYCEHCGKCGRCNSASEHSCYNPYNMTQCPNCSEYYCNIHNTKCPRCPDGVVDDICDHSSSYPVGPESDGPETHKFTYKCYYCGEPTDEFSASCQDSGNGFCLCGNKTHDCNYYGCPNHSDRCMLCDGGSCSECGTSP
jgi:hypothetical protein